MSSQPPSLATAASDRKSRLAALKNLKRKAPSPDPSTASDLPSTSDDSKPTTPHLSGRNYDPSTNQPRLGFLSTPSTTGSTAESRALALETSAKAAQDAERLAAEAEEQRALDLAALRPKKPNWDLRRELDRRMEESGLNLRTENAIARLVRERIEGQKKGQEEVGMEGSALVEATREREKEDLEDARREREYEAEIAVP